jgi:hypothetical protein
MGPSRLDSSGLVTLADASGIRQTDPVPGFWPDAGRKDHGREERIQFYVRQGVSFEQAKDLVAEEESQRGRRYDYSHTPVDADVEFKRRYACSEIRKRPCADGTTIWEPIY